MTRLPDEAFGNDPEGEQARYENASEDTMTEAREALLKAQESEPGWREESVEELLCSCGAGHGSLEGHSDWCTWLKFEPEYHRLSALSASPKPASPAPAGVEAKCPDCDGHGDRNIADATFIPCVTCLLAALKELHQAVDAEMGDTDADDRLTRAMGDAARLLALHCGEQWGDFEFRDERDDPANINNAFARGEEVER